MTGWEVRLTWKGKQMIETKHDLGAGWRMTWRKSEDSDREAMFFYYDTDADPAITLERKSIDLLREIFRKA